MARAIKAKPIVRSSPASNTMTAGREARQRQIGPTAALGAVAASLRSGGAEVSCSALIRSSRPEGLAAASPMKRKLADRQAVTVTGQRPDGQLWLSGEH